MGQKVNPHGMRVGVIKDWDSRWYASNEKVGDLLVEDKKIRDYLKKELYNAQVPKIEIERSTNGITVYLHCARPGMVIGKGVMWDETSQTYIPNTIGVEASTYYGKITENNIAEEFVYDASFIKLREISLGYQFPKNILSYLKVVKEMNVSLVARNLWTIMKHTDNIDPESAYNTSNGQGLELNGYPSTRNIGFNVNIKF